MRLLFHIFLIGSVPLFSGSLRGAVTNFRTVALSGQPAPGANATSFSSFNPPAVDGNGGILFSGMLAGAGVDASNNAGLWSNASGNLALVMRRGSPAAGLTKGVFGEAPHLPLTNDSGGGAFGILLDGSGVNNNNNIAVYTLDSSGLKLRARSGDDAPQAAGGGRYSWVGYPSLNNLGQVSFLAQIGSGSNNSAMMLDTNGTTQLIAHVGDSNPGLPSGVHIGTMYHGARLGDSGDVAFWSYLSGTGVDYTNDAAIWGGTAGVLRLVAREGMQAPGMPAGLVFDSFDFGTPKVNGLGHVAFAATASSVATNDYRGGIWAETSAGLQLVVARGDEAVGLYPGTTILGVQDSLSPLLNDHGDVLFHATLEGGSTNVWSDDSVWIKRDGQLHFIAREGDSAPGTGYATSLGNFIRMGLNNRGQVVLLVGDGSYTGIWATDVNGELKMIAHGNEMMDVDNGPGFDWRVPTNIWMADGFSDSSEESAAINDRGQVAFVATFSDGTSGVFVSDVVATPDISLPGDYDSNGVVDSGDYVAWRKNVGNPAGTLPNDIDGGQIGPAQYATWRAHFGHTLGSGAGKNANAAVPEPANVVLLLAGLLTFCSRRRATVSQTR